MPTSVFINLGKDYRPAISCITTLFGPDRIIDPEGGLGKKQQAMKKWLHDLPNSTLLQLLFKEQTSILVSTSFQTGMITFMNPSREKKHMKIDNRTEEGMLMKFSVRKHLMMAYCLVSLN